MIHDNHTIVAPATATGGAIAIIRMSGEESISICDSVFKGRVSLVEVKANSVVYGYIVDGERTLDDVLVTVFRAPHSYTGENSVEISCHGSKYIVSEIIALLMRSGARMADAGEFTVRAFLAGKLDLSQAEAVADMIASSSRSTHAMASTQMRGGYSNKLKELRDRLLHLTALLELELDFSEEDVEFADRDALRSTMESIKVEIEALQSSFSLGNVIKEGVAVAIVGAPNVGKSTLLNRLLNEERAMVSDIAGTTRDIIEAQANIDGVIFRFIDTAGIHSTDDKLEKMGIERTYSSIERANIILQIVDVTDSSASSITLRDDQYLIRIANKIDCHPDATLGDGVIGISAKTGEGLDFLVESLRGCVDTNSLYNGDAVVSNGRHYDALGLSYSALTDAISALDNQITSDLLSEDVRQVIYHLGAITGEITTDEVLGSIFSKFCIGK